MKPFYSKTPRPEGAIPIRWGCAQGWQPQVKSRRAFSLLELLAILACLALLAVMILPSFARRHAHVSRSNCVINLKQVGLSFRTWALDNEDKYPMQISVTNGGTMELVESGPAFMHFLMLSNELSTPKILICPWEPDTNRTSATTFSQNPSAQPGFTPIPFTNDTHLSYFVGVDANQSLPNALLSGDRNLAVDGVQLKRGLQNVHTNSAAAWFAPQLGHNGGGNVALADGSVQSLNDSRLAAQLQHTGMATNRLVFP
jgi:prepilin-type processing-associated H-X9-DG protein